MALRSHQIYTGPNGERVVITETDHGSGDVDHVVIIENAGTERFVARREWVNGGYNA